VNPVQRERRRTAQRADTIAAQQRLAWRRPERAERGDGGRRMNVR
jgi:hypothetical protein